MKLSVDISPANSISKASEDKHLNIAPYHCWLSLLSLTVVQNNLCWYEQMDHL